MQITDHATAQRLSLIFIVIGAAVASSYLIARTIKSMCLAAAAHNTTGIDAGTSTLVSFIFFLVLLGSFLALTVVTFPRRG